MAGDSTILWRNYDSSDQTKNNSYRLGQHIPTVDTLGWSSPTGKSFKEWNTSKDGSGTAYQPGDQIPTNLYAIWSDESYKKLINLSLLNRFLENLNTLLESIQAAIEAKIPAKYAASESAGGPATVANGIHYAQVDGSSTAKVFTASIVGITEYYDGLTVLLKNGVITSASGFTVNINGLGAKPVYSNMAAATRETTIFNVNYTLMLIYDSTRVTGGCWINYRGYYSDANSIGYQLRTDSTVLKTLDPSRYYRLMFTSADGTHWVPANTAKDNSATSQKIVNQRPIDPFGRIIYFGYTTNLSAESDVPDNYCWDQHTVTLGYSFNTSGAALELTTKTPVYIKCAPQSDGSAIIDSTTPYVQALPSTDDGMIYIYLGVAYDATNIELVSSHPVYYYKDGAIRLWTNSTQNASTVNGHTVNSDVPENAVFTDTKCMVVSITKSGTTYTADKTEQEIIDAFSDGATVVAKYGNELYLYVGRDSSGATFCSRTLVASDSVEMKKFCIRNSSCTSYSGRLDPSIFQLKNIDLQLLSDGNDAYSENPTGPFSVRKIPNSSSDSFPSNSLSDIYVACKDANGTVIPSRIIYGQLENDGIPWAGEYDTYYYVSGEANEGMGIFSLVYENVSLRSGKIVLKKIILSDDMYPASSDFSTVNVTYSATELVNESKTAASGGTALSLVTTGEKYTWNNKGTYSKPSGGIPKTDLASDVQTSLGKADTALQADSLKTINGESLVGSGDIQISGGGGDSKIVWYTDNNCTNAFIDQACTETVAEHYGYDYNSIFYDVILPATSVQLYRYDRYGVGDLLNLVSVKFDTVDETFDLNFFLPGYNWDASKWKTVSLT